MILFDVSTFSSFKQDLIFHISLHLHFVIEKHFLCVIQPNIKHAFLQIFNFFMHIGKYWNCEGFHLYKSLTFTYSIIIL
jgi:hypothetical protein